MINKFLPKFFTRLYTTMTLTICGSVYLVLILLNGFVERDDINDYLNDVTWIVQSLESIRAQNNIDEEGYYRQLDQQLYPFNIHWLPSISPLIPCNDCQYFGLSDDNIKIYRFDDGRLLSVHPIINGSGNIIFQDLAPTQDESPSNQAIELLDIEQLMPIFLLIIILLVIAITLYIPIRRLQRQITQLNRVNQLFGQGDLAIRADSQMRDPLNQLANSFNEMAQQLSETVTENKIFAQAVPHELRTPLSRIQLAAGILRIDCHLPEQQQLLDNIDQYIVDIDQLCSQVITFSQVNTHSTQQHYQEIMLKSFLATSISRFTSPATTAIELNISDDLSVFSEPAYLRLITDNLIKNAINHCRTTIKISASIEAEPYHTNIKIVIEDDGCGIQKNDFKTIFIPYSRLDQSRSRKTGGLGLGLAIAQNSAKRLSTKIVVNKSELGGASFTFRL